MIIGQGSIQIDENAKLTQDAADKAKKDGDNRERQYKSFMNGKITRSSKPPAQAGDSNQHNIGDLWIQMDEDSQKAISMWNYDGHSWVETKWDAEAMKIKNLSSLNADLGHVTSGQLDTVELNSVEINVDMNGGTTYPHDSGHNPLYWRSDGFDINNPEEGDYSGFHFKNGLMSFKAERLSGPNGVSEGYDSTYIGPNDIKVRHTPTYDAGYVDSRVDIRSNYIELGPDFSRPSTSYINSGCGIYSDGTAVVSNRLYANNASFSNSINVDNTVSANNVNADGKVSAYNVDADNWLSAGNLTVSGEVHLPNFTPPMNMPDRGAFLDISSYRSDVPWYVTANGWYNGEGVTVSNSVQCSQVIKNSTVSIKTDISKVDSKAALKNILGTDIYRYKYKDDNSIYHYGPIVDDEENIENKRFNISNNLVTSKDNKLVGFSLDDTVGMLIGGIKELSSQNENLLARLTRLEMK